MKNLYWVGPRESDINDIDQLFKGSVTIFGSGVNQNISYSKVSKRINHNNDNASCDKFFKDTLLNIIANNPLAKFLFYNQEHAYRYGPDVLAHSVGINDKSLLDILNDKSRCRYMLSDIVDVIPYITMNKSGCSYSNFIHLMPYSEFVLQKTVSSGGDGTYHITSHSDIPDIISLEDAGDYILSPYLKDGISTNIHLIISAKDVILFPSSIQIVCEQQEQLLYYGADYVCFQFLPLQIKEKIEETSLKIGRFIQKKGYKGILGIDYMINGDRVYFMELNPRFQASTELLNKSLYLQKQITMQELHLSAFADQPVSIPEELSVYYSNFVYTSENVSKIHLQKVLKSQDIFEIQLDGYYSDAPLEKERNIYLCRCVFDQNICTVSNGKTILHPNIYIENIKPYLTTKSEFLKEHVKFSLLNHGVTLTIDATNYVQRLGIMKQAVFDAIDITIFAKIKVNVPISCKFNSFSPFTIDIKGKHLVLLFEASEITDVTIDLVPDSLIGMKTSSGIPFEAIANLATDRIRINPAPICIYKKEGTGCHFCNLPEHNYQYNLADIKEVIDYCINNVEFRHFLIGGGTYSLNGGWDIIIKIAQYIKSKCSKDIYLMCVPPENVSVLEVLRNAGITEVAFNIEIFDRQLASQIMPAKGSIPYERYVKALRYAVTLWGNTGCVRSLLIYGLDTKENFVNGIEFLCSIGVEPIISIFRPLYPGFSET